PEPLLRRELAARLNAVAGALRTRSGTGRLGDFLLQGSAQLAELVRLAEIRDGALKARHPARTAAIDLPQRPGPAAARGAQRAPPLSPDQCARLERVAQICERYAAAIAAGAAPAPVESPAAEAGDSAVAELERLVRELPLAQHAAVVQPEPHAAPFVADAFTN